MNNTNSIFVLLLSICALSCSNSNNKDYDLDSRYYPLFLKKECIYRELIRRAARPSDYYERYSYVNALLIDAVQYKELLSSIMNDGESDYLERDVVAFVINKTSPDMRDEVARYYVKQLYNPYYDDYHISDHLSPLFHRHGGSIDYTRTDGKEVKFDLVCPMQEIVDIGKPSITHLLPILNDKNTIMRAKSAYLIKSIVGFDIRYDVFSPNTNEVIKLLKEKKYCD